MVVRRLWMVACGGLAGCALAGCDPDLGAQDQARIVVGIAADQPADPADGISVEISANCGSGKKACLLQVGIVGGVLLRPGDTKRAAMFCQRQVLHEPMPVLVFATGPTMEVVLQARLLDGSDEDECMGTILSEAQRAISARATSPPGADAGLGDAAASDAGPSDAAASDAGVSDAG